MLLTTLLPCALALAPAAAGSKDPVYFGKQQLSIDEALERLPAASAEALGAWSTWGLEHGYVFAFDATAQILFVTAEPKRAKQRAALLTELVERLDGLWMGATPLVPEGRGVQVAWSVGDDFELPGARAGMQPLGSGPAVVFQFKETEHLPEILGRLATEHAYLQDWLPQGGALASFTLEWPHVAGFALTHEQQEYDPDNELVHLATECLASRNFGNLPPWLRTGLAWKMEWDLRDSIYCFPGRDEFVFELEHSAWETDLRASFKSRLKNKRDLRPLEATEFMGWETGVYEPDAARLCFGMASFLIEEHDEALAQLLQGLRAAHEEGSLLLYPDEQRWERRLPYALPAERQLELLQQVAGPEVLRDAEAWFAKGLK